MRGYRKVREARDEDNPHIEYDVDKSGSKVTARVKDTTSASLTKLGKKITVVKELEEQIKQMRKDIEAESREVIASLFDADDEVRTRVIETVSFYLKLTKMPKPTETVSWSKVVKELEANLTPELLEMLKDLKAKYTKVSQKPPGLSYGPANESKNLNEGVVDKLTSYFKKFFNFVTGWCKRYDSQLDALKAEIGM